MPLSTARASASRSVSPHCCPLPSP